MADAATEVPSDYVMIKRKKAIFFLYLEAEDTGMTSASTALQSSHHRRSFSSTRMGSRSTRTRC